MYGPGWGRAAAIGPGGNWLTAAAPKAPVVPPFGFIYTKYSAPLTLPSMNNAGVSAVPVHNLRSQSFMTTRVGVPYYSSISAAWGDVNYHDLAQAAGMKKVYYADYEVFNILTAYSTFTITLYGE